MKDLYERLNLSPDVPESMIRRRLRRIDDEELEEAVQEVLLHSDRREIYDRNHRVLELIGDLRTRLELNDTPNWKQSETEDFTESTRDVGSGKGRSVSSTRRETQASATRSALWTVAYWCWNIVRGVVELVLAIVVGFLQGVLPMALIFGFFGLILWGVIEFSNKDAQDHGSDGRTRTTEQTEDFEENPSERNSGDSDPESVPYSTRPIPANGKVWNFTAARRIAPLRISVSPGNHYYIKVVDAYTEERVITLFIRSGRRAQVEVPTGTYRVKYATGKNWYGRENHFGPEPHYLKADDTFTFEIVGQQVRGHRIELVLQEGGNLRTESIPEGDF